jgi:poly(glycerol-phosphate) alpha-glucosyltransferase
VPVKVFRNRGIEAFGYAPGLLPALHSADLDLLHNHGLWMYPSVAALRWSQVTRKP